MKTRVKAGLMALGFGAMVVNCTPATLDDASNAKAKDNIANISTDKATKEVLGTAHLFRLAPIDVDPALFNDENSDDPRIADPTPTRGDVDVVDQIDLNLARLEALEIFEVGELIVDVPAEAYNCYGPCPGFENAEADAIELSAQRLADFADLAENAAAQPTSDLVCDDATNDANLDALDALGIVQVGDLMVFEPKSSANCYNLPCNEDIAEANEINNQRAAMLANIVHAADKSYGTTP
jgi:hypothetical protein